MIRLLPALALLVSACAGGDPVPPPAGDGALPRIVSLNPCTDAILAEVAAPGQLLAISHYSKDPRASSMDPAVAARMRATGGTAEEILALAPDLVVASSYIGPATKAALERLGMRVETFGVAHDVAESEAQVRAIAALAGQPVRGAALVARMEQALAAARPSDNDRIEVALWQEGGIVPGEGELVADLLRHAGFASYAARRGMVQADYLALEQILRDPPRLLLITGQGRGQVHPALGRVEGMAVHRLDPALTYCGGPTIIRAAAALAAIRRPLGQGSSRR